MEILVFVVIAILGLYLGAIRGSPMIRGLCRLGLLLIGLGSLLLAAACFCFPIFSRADGSGILMLLSIFPGFFGVCVLMAWSNVYEVDRIDAMPETEKRAYVEEQFQKLETSLDDSIAENEDRADGLFTSSRERYRLQQKIRQEEGLKTLNKMAKESYDDYTYRQDHGLPQLTPWQRIQRLFRNLFTPPSKR